MPQERSSLRVLIVDDDPVIRSILTSTVMNEGYAAIEVSDGREAYRLLQSDADFGAAIFDLRMPCLSGIDLIGYMHTEKRLRRIPVMLVTAETDLRIMSHGFAAGAVAYLPKPFTREQVLKAIRMLLKNPPAAHRPAAA